MGELQRIQSARRRRAAGAFALVLAPAFVVLLSFVVAQKTLVVWIIVFAIVLALWERLRS